jgi:uncharacterized protein YpbB
MDTPEEKAAFDDGKDYVVHAVQEWIKKQAREATKRIECAARIHNLLKDLEVELKKLQG